MGPMQTWHRFDYGDGRERDFGFSVLVFECDQQLTHQPFVTQLAVLYKKIDWNGGAVVTVRRREALNGNCPLVQNNACRAARNVEDLYAKTGRRADADRLRLTATRDWAGPAGLFP
jgi:hypothetical protein